jgi:V-type H+-transporting ATPase subunit a
MTFALCLQIPNHLRFKRFSDLWTSFLPQLLFLESIFGYLVLCIIYKWSVDWPKANASPPSLLNMLIGMFLSPGTITSDTRLYPGQGFVQVVLLLLAAVCIPWMLCVKPYIEWKELKKTQEQGYVGLSHAEDGNGYNAAPRDTDLEDGEEGNGQAHAEEDDEGHVCAATV